MSRKSSFLINRKDISVEEVFKTIHSTNDSNEIYKYLESKVYKNNKDRHSYHAISFILGMEANKRSFEKNKSSLNPIFYLDIDQIILKLDMFMNDMENMHGEDDIIIKNINKLLDHLNLEKLHLDNMNRMKTSYEENIKHHKSQLEKNILNYEKKLEKSKQEIDEKSKSLHKEVIGLLGIFTALAFISFGGVSVLDKFFEGIGKSGIRLRQLIISGSFTSIAIISIVYLFLYGIVQITETKKIEANKNMKNIYIISIIILSMGILLAGGTYFVEDPNLINFIHNSIAKVIQPIEISYFIKMISWIMITAAFSVLIVVYIIKPTIGINITYSSLININNKKNNNQEENDSVA